MPDDKVTIDPAFRPSKGGRDGEDGPGLRWIGIAAMVAAAIVFGWLLRSPVPGTPEHAGSDALAFTTTTDTSVGSASKTGRPSPVVSSVPLEQAVSNVPLGEVVPGFVDTITTLTWGNHGVDILRWRASQPAPETMVSLDHDDGAWNRSVDASGRWLIEIRGDSVLTVHAVNDGGARSGRRQPFKEMGGARGWSAVWHDTRPGRLAWLGCPTEASGSSITLFTTDVTVQASDPMALPLRDFGCEDPGVWLARWGEWGMLLHTTEGSGTAHVLLNAEGTEVAQGRLGPEGEWFVGFGPGTTTVWTEGLGRKGASSFLLSPDGLDRKLVPGLNHGERLESALGSPDGSLLALVPDLAASYGSVVRIVEADTGSVVAEIAEPSWWVTRMVWSTDSRFLVYERWPDVTSNWAGVPQDVELVFYDTKAKTGVAFPLPGYAPALRSAA